MLPESMTRISPGEYILEHEGAHYRVSSEIIRRTRQSNPIHGWYAVRNGERLNTEPLPTYRDAKKLVMDDIGGHTTKILEVA